MNAPTPVVRKRTEMLSASLDFGGEPIDLADYATTGLVSVAVAPRGLGKTNVGLVMAEQLAPQGWVSVLVDPEDELAALYGQPVADPEDLRRRLIERNENIIVVSAHDAAEFVPYGQVIFEVADEHRKPIFVAIDGRAAAVLAVADSVKAATPDALRALSPTDLASLRRILSKIVPSNRAAS